MWPEKLSQGREEKGVSAVRWWGVHPPWARCYPEPVLQPEEGGWGSGEWPVRGQSAGKHRSALGSGPPEPSLSSP